MELSKNMLQQTATSSNKRKVGKMSNFSIDYVQKSTHQQAKRYQP